MMKLSIKDIGFDGEGVGRVDDKVCFVRFALVGEKVEVEPYQVHLKYIKANLSTLFKLVTKEFSRHVLTFHNAAVVIFSTLAIKMN